MNEDNMKPGSCCLPGGDCRPGDACPPGMACKPGAACRCPHHLTGPIFIVAVGIILLLSALGILDGRGLSVTFAVLVIAAGITMAMKRSCRCCGRR